MRATNRHARDKRQANGVKTGPKGCVVKKSYTLKTGETRTRWHVVLEAGKGPDGKRRQRWHGGYETREIAELMKVQVDVP